MYYVLGHHKNGVTNYKPLNVTYLVHNRLAFGLVAGWGWGGGHNTMHKHIKK